MVYRLLADLVVLLHLAFILFALFGGLLALRWRGAAVVHVPALAWGVLIEIAGWVCPLTPLENRLRVAGGAAGYEGGFIERYLIPILYPAALTPALQLGLAALLIAVNIAVYALVLYRRLGPRRAKGI